MWLSLRSFVTRPRSGPKISRAKPLKGTLPRTAPLQPIRAQRRSEQFSLNPKLTTPAPPICEHRCIENHRLRFLSVDICHVVTRMRCPLSIVSRAGTGRRMSARMLRKARFRSPLRIRTFCRQPRLFHHDLPHCISTHASRARGWEPPRQWALHRSHLASARLRALPAHRPSPCLRPCASAQSSDLTSPLRLASAGCVQP